jgi:hypothetical protein
MLIAILSHAFEVIKEKCRKSATDQAQGGD